ncbi:MAG: hypothetical protein KME07_22290 [Pegethrix bostrychoides GSE-TBD4-15B]|jgi:uncharacterized protein YrrD|uniref:PRC-barrel domain-containing protein n=1 Tax=Pegethrix bostrychoides GSE-TBD4-15B TaxID=2839662 RepID=A0A951U734_9CYAN|nr:hypothetical protein [Pegethrix bostrychoides GSE-TBD4-15B]
MTRELIRQSDLINQLVLDRSTMEELGRVDLLWSYPPSHRVLGFICKSGFLGNQKSAFQLGQIGAIGVSGLLMQGQPEKTTVERVRRLESLIDHEIWSEDGNRIGRIVDCLFLLQTGEITQYLFVSSGWTGVLGEFYQLPPSQILGFGKQRVRVAEAEFELYQPSLSQKLSQSLSQRAEVTAEQAKVQLQQAKVKAQQLSQQLTQKAQVLKAQVSETTQVLLEQVESGFETISTQVEEAFESIEAPARPDFRSLHQENLEPTSDQSPVRNLDCELEDIWGDDWEADQAVAPKPVVLQSDSPEPVVPQPESQRSAQPDNLENLEDKNLEDDEPWI